VKNGNTKWRNESLNDFSAIEFMHNLRPELLGILSRGWSTMISIIACGKPSSFFHSFIFHFSFPSVKGDKKRMEKKGGKYILFFWMHHI
jgi:hypothetical protein